MKPRKLLQKALSSPGNLRFEEACNLARAFGFHLSRARGSHHMFARQGVRIERVMTDNAKNYVQSHDFQAALSDLGARHKRTRPFRPQTNGKAERFIQTLLREWAYARAYSSSAQRHRQLPRWLNHYNRRRPHGGIGFQPPISRIACEQPA